MAAFGRRGEPFGGMKPTLFWLGRSFQLLSLLVLPSAIWAAEFYHSEVLSVGILVAALLAFAAGYFLTQMAVKL